MIGVSELRTGVSFKLDGRMFVVLKYEHTLMGRGSANIKVKVRDLESGAVVEKSFFPGAKVEPVELRQREANYLYKAGELLVFMDVRTYEQFELPVKLLGEQEKFLQEGTVVRVMFTSGDKPFGGAQGKVVAVDLPPKLTFKVAEADPGVKGNSAANMLKSVKLSNGLTVRAPLFINEGDSVVVDTRTGEYVERAK